ncbi:hypothetical protein DFJ74DRAFT_688163 [Hyaloraphidium curvatum]|nr:hypothetical protein DFJ74DRAFT_688163 [Hyaloraphidium curvatum]
MATLAAENALLRAENAGLHSEVAALRAEVVALHERLAQAGCGADASRDTEPSPVAPVPTLPPELVLSIAAYFPPRSPVLLRMMLACREFRDLVRPRFLSELDIRQMFYPERAVKNFVPERYYPTTDKFESVRTLVLDLTCWESGMVERFRRLLYACTGLQNGSFTFASWRDVRMVFSELRKDNLRELRLCVKGEADEPGWFDHMPRLSVFSYAGRPNRTLFHGLVDRCPCLESVDCELWGLRHLSNETLKEWLPAQFRQKIRTWTYLNVGDLRLALDMEGFSPTAIVWDGESDSESPSEPCWELITGLRSVRTLSFDNFDPDLFLSGLPPNLEELQAFVVHVTGRPAAVLDGIATALKSGHVRLVFTLFCPSEDENLEDLTVARMRAMKREILFWESLENAEIGRWDNDVRDEVMAVSDSDSDLDEI